VKVASQFKRYSRIAGKVKYPLIYRDTLFLTDPVAVYALDKNTGEVLWARPGVDITKMKAPGGFGKTQLPLFSGIYSDPVISGGQILYGTRTNFMARTVRNGRVSWDNQKIKMYGGFPTFYDEFIFTQSSDLKTGRFIVHCLKARTGETVWRREIQKPIKIFPPVVYKNKVYIPSGQKIYALDLKTGEVEWSKDYGQYITSNPSFTDRAILFSVNNSDLLVIDPDNGSVTKRIPVSPRSNPYYVTIRDQVYLAYNEAQNTGAQQLTYANLKAMNFDEETVLWQFQPPFPGAVSQPVAAGGILFLPAGNYLYAVGARHYSRIVQGGSGFRTQPGKGEKPVQRKAPEKEEVKTRKMRVNIRDENNRPVTGEVEVKKRENGRLIYSKKETVDGSGIIEFPDKGKSDIIVNAPGYVPNKTTVEQNQNETEVELQKLETQKSYNIQNILFELNKAYLEEESKDILDELVKMLRQNPSLKLEVRGHTDATGDAAYNLKLSERRADSVREYMIKHGISPERIRAVGFGETRPIAPNATEEGRAKNRRTEFYFIR
jgi:outer membrane protein OmpA-like peptidoglycan-associated protein